MPLYPQLNKTLVTKVLRLLNTCTNVTQLYQIQAQIILHNLHQNTRITFNFINACNSHGLLSLAFKLFYQLHRPHVFICNNLMKAFSHAQMHYHSIAIFTNMHKNSISPNNYSFPFLLKSLSDLTYLSNGQSVHAHVVKTGHSQDLYVQNALLGLYSSCGEHMRTSEYLFDQMPQRDVVSWTVLISGYRRVGNLDEALVAFERMQFAGVLPNRVTMVNVLAACADFGALDMGVWVHEEIRRNGWELDVILGTSLVDMYGKCGRIEAGLTVFESMVEKNTFTWNSLIIGLALAKNGEEALSYFSKMEGEGIKADQVTLIGVLCACCHAGLVQTGRHIFHSLIEGKYGFSPGIKHYGCMLDLLGRSGFLNEALSFMKSMPFEPNAVMWGSLLAGCRAHGDLKLSEYAARRLVELEPHNSAYYVFLSNLYAEMERWNDVEEVRKLMKEKGMNKDMASSSVDMRVPEERYFQLLASS